MTEKSSSNEQGFVPGQHYKFDPPVETNCISVGSGQWTQKRFAEGWCFRFEQTKEAFAFQGKPIDDKAEYYFFVQCGKGSVAEETPPPRL